MMKKKLQQKTAPDAAAVPVACPQACVEEVEKRQLCQLRLRQFFEICGRSAKCTQPANNVRHKFNLWVSRR